MQPLVERLTSLFTMPKGVKKVAVKKTVTKKKEAEPIVCTNCDNSGMTCNSCDFGKTQE